MCIYVYTYVYVLYICICIFFKRKQFWLLTSSEKGTYFLSYGNNTIYSSWYNRLSNNMGLNYAGALMCRIFSIINIPVLHDPWWVESVHAKELPKWQKHEYTEQTGFSTMQ